MLALVGFIFTDFYTLPGFEYTTLEAHDACVASGSMSQLLLWIGLLEVVSTISIDQMLRGSGREPGDYGFDPVGFGSDPEKLKDLQMKVLATGRLAMFAFSGAVTQSVLTGNTFPYLFGDATTFGSGGDFRGMSLPPPPCRRYILAFLASPRRFLQLSGLFVHHGLLPTGFHHVPLPPHRTISSGVCFAGNQLPLTAASALVSGAPPVDGRGSPATSPHPRLFMIICACRTQRGSRARPSMAAGCSRDKGTSSFVCCTRF